MLEIFYNLKKLYYLEVLGTFLYSSKLAGAITAGSFRYTMPLAVFYDVYVPSVHYSPESTVSPDFGGIRSLDFHP